MQINFTKMHGLGNDFVVIDAVHQAVDLSASQLRHIADRRLGIGCDQILLVEKPRNDAMDFRYRIFNADGGEVEQCGNGARCFARFVIDKGMTDKSVIAVETNTGNIELSMHEDGQVTVNMGPARLHPPEIPFIADQQATEYLLEIEDQALQVGVVSMGNPHCVLRVEDVDTAPVQELGPLIEHHRRFPNRVNVGFMQVLDRANIRLRVWERGAGETLACGTGACAAVVSGILRGWLDTQVVVHLRMGKLVIDWQSADQPVFMTGPAQSVFDGTIQL